MRTIRVFEERLRAEFAAGGIPGFVHLYAGEEVAAAGVCAHLDGARDVIASTHRGYGHCTGEHVDVRAVMAEIFGRATGARRGKGGSTHIADLGRGTLGANGIVGGGPPLVCGAALAAKPRGGGGVGVAFFGDGASSQGATLESLNLASAWHLPAVFVAENNGYAKAAADAWSVAGGSVAARAAAFGMPGMPGTAVDGCDFFAVHEAAGAAVVRAREGGGPTLAELELPRFSEHFEGDRQTCRAVGEAGPCCGLAADFAALAARPAFGSLRAPVPSRRSRPAHPGAVQPRPGGLHVPDAGRVVAVRSVLAAEAG